ncbi:hypothetical protein P4U43_06125 [Arthrobacter sp. EH-1B-1]|uniref:Uncharacterized protein n=1 Tax=Arthrobacter vasquezii TaxID=2977629 RepID=A0ABT6CTI2_9MICC|nr:DUF6541 family protein [Arthrobacter vasquezii]MDF9277369.1 hypothetical protein [Arthrobacter vasquezii]
MPWWDALPSVFVAAALVLLPGGIFAACLGFKIDIATGLAPAFSVAMSGVAAVILSIMGVGWSPTTFGLTAIVMIILALLLRVVLRQPTQLRHQVQISRRSLLGGTLGLVLGSVASAYNLVRIFDNPDNIAQRYDNVFHLNAVRYVLEQGDASTLTLGRMLQPDAAVALYPAVWHGFAALVVQATGQDIPVSVNSLNIVLASLVWPLSLLLLARTIFGSRFLALVFTGLFSAGLPSFPLGLIDFGPLYPNIVSYAILPAALALVLAAVKAGSAPRFHPAVLALALLATAAGLLLAQPNGFVALMALSLPAVIWRWWCWLKRIGKERGPKSTWLPLLAAAAFAVVFGWIWESVLISYDTWLPFTRYASAIGQALTSAPHEREIPVAIAFCTAIGLAILVRRGRWPWLIGIYGVSVLLYVVAAAQPRGAVRIVFTGAWYQDPQRLAALLPLPTIIIAAYGAACLTRMIAERTASLGRLAPVKENWISALAWGLAAAVAVVIAVLSQRGPIDQMVLESRFNHTYEGNPTILSPDELQLLERLDRHVPEQAEIAVNPWNGGSLAFAFSGREVTQYHMSSEELGPELEVLANNLSTASTDSKACEIARDDNVQYVLDFGERYLLDREAAHKYPAFDGVDKQKATNYQLVDQEGSAKLYAITNCF